MAGGKVSTVAKPNLRNLLQNNVRNNLGLAVVLCIVAATSFKIFRNDVRKEKYANFYKNYNINAEFEKMRQKGLFDSC
ncbi:cytochrome c oxidase subunit 6C-like [Rhynchophorus ferrugineus]|uniref:cytochrome c oxidase subunit 6C-like n=1 Tax=Rhynchophorus ferrugineus TaxID=354439 RepID=UPI003FCD559A